MNRKQRAAITASLLATIIIPGCSQRESPADNATVSEEMMEMAADYEPSGGALSRGVTSYISSAAATVKDDTTRKFVLTAQLKFRVKDAVASTYNIEEITVRNGGFVASSRLSNRIESQTRTKVSRDSILETTYYIVENKLELRTPAASLDAVLKEIALNIETLDYRDIQSSDVTLDFLEYSLARKREERASRRAAQAIARKSASNTDDDNGMTPEELLRNSEEQADNAMLNAMRLANRVDFATITILLFQRPVRHHETLPAEGAAKAYRPGLLSKVSASFVAGWAMIEGALLFVISVWPLLIVILMAVFGWKFARVRKG
jgi:hypothetical protein